MSKKYKDKILIKKRLALYPDNKVDEVEAYNNFISGIYYDPSHIPKVNPNRYNNTK